MHILMLTQINKSTKTTRVKNTCVTIQFLLKILWTFNQVQMKWSQTERRGIFYYVWILTCRWLWSPWWHSTCVAGLLWILWCSTAHSDEFWPRWHGPYSAELGCCKSHCNLAWGLALGSIGWKWCYRQRRAHPWNRFTNIFTQYTQHKMYGVLMLCFWSSIINKKCKDKLLKTPKCPSYLSHLFLFQWSKVLENKSTFHCKRITLLLYSSLF